MDQKVKTACESSLRIPNSATSEIYLSNVAPLIETLELGLKRLAINSEPFEAVPMKCCEKTDTYGAEILRIRKKYVSNPNASNLSELTSTRAASQCLCNFTGNPVFSIHNKGGGEK